MERLDDPARVVVLLLRERPPIHHGPGVVLGMVIRGQRQRPQRALLHPMFVHEALHLHGEALRRRHEAIRNRVRAVAGDDIAHGPLAEAPELPLRQRPEHDHALGHSRRHRCRGICKSAGATAAATAPLHVGETQVVNAERSRQPRRIAAIVREGRESIHLLRRDASILASRQDRHQRQLELRIRCLPALVVGGLPHPSDGNRAPQTTLHDLPPTSSRPYRSIARQPNGRHRRCHRGRAPSPATWRRRPASAGPARRQPEGVY